VFDLDLHKRDANEAERAPNEENFGLEVGITWALIHHVWCSIRDCPVECPVRCRGHTQALCTGLERVEFSSDNPCDWAPRTGEEENVQTHESDGSALSCEIGSTGHGSCDGYNVY
jgi:hypothetical protein